MLLTIVSPRGSSNWLWASSSGATSARVARKAWTLNMGEEPGVRMEEGVGEVLEEFAGDGGVVGYLSLVDLSRVAGEVMVTVEVDTILGS